MSWVSVSGIVTGDTIEVWPQWTVSGTKGGLVRVNGLSAPAPDSARGMVAHRKLVFLISGCTVFIKHVHGLNDGALVCDVYYAGRNIVDHFPEYAAETNRILSTDDTDLHRESL